MAERRWDRVAVAALVLLGTVTVAPTAGAVSPMASPSGDSCRVVALKTPAGAPWGTVMDIEVVDGQTVYYGSVDVLEGGEPHQRAALWRGLDAEPEFIGPSGSDADIALELTSSGLANGQSEDWASGRQVAWVYDLGTGNLTSVDTGRGQAEGDHPWVRRINEQGAMAGVISRGVGKEMRAQAFGWQHYSGSPIRLTAPGEGSQALGINDVGERAGMRVQTKIFNGTWAVFDPVLWDAQGRMRTVAKIGLDGVVRGITEDGQMAGFSFIGPDPAVGFVQATYWASPDQVVGLGVLDGGGWSDAFGIDDTGWVVGGMDRFVPEDEPLGEGSGMVRHSFLRTPDMQPAEVRILPSLYATAHDVDDWQQWASLHPAHAVNSELDQAGAGTHVGYSDEGRLLSAPTVYLNASTCGSVVDTTQDPWHLTDRAAAQDAAGVTGDPSRPMRPRR